MTTIYLIAAIAGIVEVVLFAILSDKKVRFYSAAFFVFSAISNLGLYVLSKSTTLGEAILANKIFMLGSAFLPLVTMFITFEMAKINLPKIARVGFISLAVFVYSLILTEGHTNWFAREIELIDAGGVSVLKIVPSWGQFVFVASMYLYAVGTIIGVIIPLVKKRQVPRINLILMTVIYISQFAINAFGRGAFGALDISSIHKAIANLVFLIVIYRMPLYDTDEALLVSNAKRMDVAYILMDKHFRFMGCSTTAKDFIPAISTLQVDRPIKSNIEELQKIRNWVEQYDPENEVIRELQCNNKDLLINIQYLYHENIKRGYIISITDDHMRQEQIRMIHAMSENKSKFLSNVSHEIRTPVNSVLGLNEMILRESKDPQILDYASCIDVSGKTLLSLINDILDMSRIEAGKLVLQPMDYSLKEMLLEIERMMNPLVAEKKLKFEIHLNESIPDKLYGDGSRIKQMLVNLLTNAVKYTDAGMVIFGVDGLVRGDQIGLDFRVIDSGRGIKEEDIPYLFTAYERVDEAKNRGIIGTGLGLSITKRFADMMGGTIDVESEYGKGSAFILRVTQDVKSSEPISSLKERRQETARTKSTESFHAPSARILSVDDVVVNQKVIVSLLKRTQIQVDTAGSGKECIAKLKENTYDLVLLDHMMPEMDGVETLHVIRDEKLAEGTPIIALTANAVGDAKSEYLALGFDGYLSKPIAVAILEKTLIDFLPGEKVEIL